jgi:diguanylate cyclase (GGDEF)-like protein
MGAAVRMPMLLEGAERCITISGGIATLSGSDIRPEEILRLADRALYDAKRNGRDRVVVAA